MHVKSFKSHNPWYTVYEKLFLNRLKVKSILFFVWLAAFGLMPLFPFVIFPPCFKDKIGIRTHDRGPWFDSLTIVFDSKHLKKNLRRKTKSFKSTSKTFIA